MMDYLLLGYRSEYLGEVARTWPYPSFEAK